MISYAGVPLVLDNPQIHEWIQTNWGTWEDYFADDSTVSEAFAWVERRKQKAPKIGKLYWPNGASRWGVGCFLATGTQLQSIPRTADPRTLALSDGTHEPVQAQMILLPPRVINYTTVTDSVYALIFVDQRYFWQYAPCDEWEIGDSLPGGGNEDVSVVPDPSESGERNPEWYKLIDDVVSPALSDLNGLTVEITRPEIDASYLRADIESLGRVGPENNKARNAANLLDAIAINVGAEVAVNYDGEIALLNWDNATGAGSFVRMIGGDTYDIEDLSQNMTPSQVKVMFRKVASDGTLWGTYYSSTNDAGGNIGTKVIQDTAKAICDSADGDPSNKTALDTLAETIASDWYQRFRYNFDTVFQGICPVVPSSGIDLIEFTYSMFAGYRPLEDRISLVKYTDESQYYDYDLAFDNSGVPMCSTRILSRPENEGFDRLNHQDPEAPFLGDGKAILVKLTEYAHCAMDGTATALKCNPVTGTPLDPEVEVEVDVRFTTPSKYFGIGFIEDRIWVVPWMLDNDEESENNGRMIFRPVQNGHQSCRGVTNETINEGGSGSASLYFEALDTGIDVTVYDSHTIADSIGGSTDIDLEWRGRSEGRGRWEITGYYFECP